MKASDNRSWAEFATAFRNSAQPLAGPWADMFGPLRGIDGTMIVGQLGQSLDGRIATENGHSHYINGPAGILHLHRLRSLTDAVVVGVGTAIADNPQLTVRHCEGPQPARVVIDPKGRLGAEAKMFCGEDARRILVTADGAHCPAPAGVEIIALPAPGGRISPHDVIAALSAHGLRRLLIEGGAETVSRFLAAGCLDRLHVMVAPMILGSGRPGFTLPAIERCDQALRPPMRTFSLDSDTLFDIDLSALVERI